MDVLSNLNTSYERHQQEWVDKIKEPFSAYVDTMIDRFLSSMDIHQQPTLIFGMGGWSFSDEYGQVQDTELDDFLETICQIVEFHDPFPAEYVGKYAETTTTVS